MELREVTAVYCENNTEYINRARWQNAEISNAKAMLYLSELNSDNCYQEAV